MAAGAKFGTFGGVYTPSLLTILGVIMYLRLPRVVGEAGLLAAIGIIVVAHVISVSTGFSISSIATDKKVGAGGPYYIVSRSLGLPIGGTLGLALFVGLSFSISLYIIGFAESFLSYWDIEPTPNAVRLAGVAVLIALSIVTLISTAFAIKTQYIIFALIGCSLVSVVLGSPESVPTTPHLKAPDGAPSLATIFGVFFPAVTGFTAGVNMSGDLSNPRKAIPRGTMAAIGTGLLVYLGLAVFLGYRVPVDQLINNQNILLDIALFGPAVVGGIWGATLSSALGSIMGAPRILQAVSNDGITPRFFGHGHGPSAEPRRALVVAFVIALAGILIAELDAIARIVSMVFLATYGVLNLSCAIESWTSPDFRPTFRIPRWVSLLGALTSLLVMIQLDLAAMAGAAVLMGGLFVWLERRQLQLSSGDAWEGVWSSLVRSGLFRLSKEQLQQRNWRPNIVLFPGPHDDVVSSFAYSLVQGLGLLTRFGSRKTQRKTAVTDDLGPQLGVFHRPLPSGDLATVVNAVCHNYGFAGIQPNTLMLGLDQSDEPELIQRALASAREVDFNFVAVVPAGSEQLAEDKERIDVWWFEDAGNLPFSLALLRFVTTAAEWENTPIRMLIASNESAANDRLRAVARRLIAEARVEAEVRVVNIATDVRTRNEWIVTESADASLTVLCLPNEDDNGDLGETWGLVTSLRATLFLHAGSAFPEIMRAGRAASISTLPPPPGDGIKSSLPKLELPKTPDLADAGTAFANRSQRRLGAFHEKCLQPLYAGQIDLVRELKKLATKHFKPVQKGSSELNPRKQATTINRAISSFLLDAREIVHDYETKVLSEHKELLADRLERLAREETFTQLRLPDQFTVRRELSDFAFNAKDPAYIRRFKRRRRWIALVRKSAPYDIDIATLARFYYHRMLTDVVLEAATTFKRNSFQLAAYLGRVINSARITAALLEDDSKGDDDSSPLETAQQELQTLLDRMEELVVSQKEHSRNAQWHLLTSSRELAQSFADDIDRLDIHLLIKRRRQLPKNAFAAIRGQLGEISDHWHEYQVELVRRIGLTFELGEFRHRFIASVQRDRETLIHQVESGALRPCRELLQALGQYREQLEAAPAGELPPFALELELRPQFDTAGLLENILRNTNSATATLPESVETISDGSIPALEEGHTESIERVDVPLRRLLHFVVETDFVGELQAQLGRVPAIEQGALSVAQDVIRLMSLPPDQDEQDPNEADPRQKRLEVLTAAEDRVRAEIAKLELVGPRLATALREQLEKVIDAANAYDLTSLADTLNQRMRRHQREQAVSGARALILRARRQLERWSVDAVYRRSTATLLARRLHLDAQRSLSSVERVLRTVRSCTPRPAVLEGLPFYYRQLFLGQSSIPSSFWVGREMELMRARDALDAHRRGAKGCLLVTGEKGSGKTALVERVLQEASRMENVYRVLPHAAGSSQISDFRAALQSATEKKGSAAEQLAAISPGATIVIDDLELWWDRGGGGFAVIDNLIELLERFGQRHLFVLAGGTQGLSYINRLRPLSDLALATIECAPVDAETLQRIILARHASGGMKFDLDRKSEEELNRLTMARLFSSHFDYSAGSIGAGLRSWVTHIEKVRDDTVSVTPPDAPTWDALDGLRVEHTALLVQLVLHKRLNASRLRRISNQAPDQLERSLAALTRADLVTSGRRQTLELNPFVQHAVVTHLAGRGLLS